MFKLYIFTLEYLPIKENVDEIGLCGPSDGVEALIAGKVAYGVEGIVARACAVQCRQVDSIMLMAGGTGA